MILLDTSFIIAFYSEVDKNHKKARELMKRIVVKEFGDLFISDYIIDEVATGLLKKTGITETVRICGELLESAYLLTIDEALFYNSLDLFKKQKNTLLSFTDCSNVAVMDYRGIKNLAAFDDDFKSVKSINLISV